MNNRLAKMSNGSSDTNTGAAEPGLPLLMTHLIPFFPDEEKSRAIARVLLNEGARYVELQFPFTDPSADGQLIEAACQHALQQGFTVDRGFAFVHKLMQEEAVLREGRADIFLMTYASLVFARGVKKFVREAAEAGIAGLIVPDLPPDSDEGLKVAADECKIEVVPVLAANSRPERIQLIQNGNPRFIYCALRTGITGKKTDLGEENMRFLDVVGSTGAKILAGFGIVDYAQVKALAGHVHAAVVGSAFLRALANTSASSESEQACAAAVRQLARHLLGKDA